MIETVNSAVSFESMDMIITIVSISIRLVVIYRMPPSKKISGKLKQAIDENKTQVIQKKITESYGDQKKLFNIVNTLLDRLKQLVLPDYNNPITLASTFNMFLLIRLQTFVQSFHCLRAHYPLTRLS